MMLFLLLVLVLTSMMVIAFYIIKKYTQGNYNGIWYIIASCMYFCILFLGAIYFFGITL
jgi:hypothetical protein